MPKEAERKSRRKFKARYQHVPALPKQLLDRLLGRRAMWDVRKVSQSTFQKTATPGGPARLSVCRSTRFDQNGERRQQKLLVLNCHQHFGWLTGKNVIGKPGSHGQIAQRQSCCSPRNK